MYFAKHLDIKKDMRLLKITSVLSILTLFCTINTTIAQNNIQRNLLWEKSEITNPDEKTTRKVESFNGAIFDYRFKDLSLYTEKFNGSYANFKIVNPVYEALTIELSKAQLDQIAENPITFYPIEKMQMELLKN
jgi:hypothetical protein